MEKSVLKPSGLISLLIALQSHEVVLELRNQVLIRGTLECVDERLNCVLRGAQSGGVTTEMMWVAGRNVKYFHLPSKMQPDAVWRHHVKERAKLDQRRRPAPKRSKDINTPLPVQLKREEKQRELLEKERLKEQREALLKQFRNATIGK